MKTRPYVIVAPNYSVSADARAMHSLCHELNTVGFEARLLLTPVLSPSGTPMLNPALRTPCLNGTFEQEWSALNEQAVVVCSDGFQGHPFDALRVVRYVLSKEVPEPDDNAVDFKVYASRAFPADKGGRHPVLFQLNCDLADFNEHCAVERTQDLLWQGKGAPHCTERPPGAIEITDTWPPAWPHSRPELAAQLRKTRLLYSYDALSAINVEAILCGATVVLKHFGDHEGGWTKQDLEATETGSGGYAYGDSEFEIDRALRTRQELVNNVRYQQAIFKTKLLEFVDQTQRHFR
jgi:hypothetical protein